MFAGGNRGTIFSGIGFVGIVIGQVSFGFIVDRVGRRNSMFIANIIVIVFSILATAAWAPTPDGVFRLLTAWRFFQGVGLAVATRAYDRSGSGQNTPLGQSQLPKRRRTTR